MSKIVNLRQARKAKTRAEKARKAEENAAKFGRTKPQKVREAAEKAASIVHLDGHKRDDR